MTGVYVVTRSPALLAGMPYPEPTTDWADLHRQGFRRLVRLHRGDYDPRPLVADDVQLEDLYGGRDPADPDAERERIVAAADLVAAYVRRGDGVLVHCVGGTGRTGTVLACALLRLGSTPDAAIAAVRAHRPHWPESAWHESVVRAGSV